RDLVELVPTEEAADRRVQRIGRRHEARADALPGVPQPGAELVDRERLHAAPDARATVEDRSAAGQLDPDRDDDRDRAQDEEADHGHRELPQAAEAALGKGLD